MTKIFKNYSFVLTNSKLNLYFSNLDYVFKYKKGYNFSNIKISLVIYNKMFIKFLCYNKYLIKNEIFSF